MGSVGPCRNISGYSSEGGKSASPVLSRLSLYAQGSYDRRRGFYKLIGSKASGNLMWIVS